jgi:hypothetical protein
LSGLVHAFVPTVLLGMRRLDQLGIDAEAGPPHRQLGQAAESRRGERDTVVGADDARETVLSEKRLEHGLGEVHGRRVCGIDP